MAVSRRALLWLGATSAASVVAGCSRTVRRLGGSGSASTAAFPTGSVGRTTVALTHPPSSSHPAETGHAVEIEHGPRTRSELAFTFHGDGDLHIARHLLAIFAAHQAKVTVMAVGNWLAANPSIAREIVAGGHELGNHTYNHLDIDSLDEATARDEIVRCRDVLRAQVGSGGTLFRQSQAKHASPLVKQLAGMAGYPVCLSYDVDSFDYTDPGPAAIRSNVVSAQAGSIVSMHFGHQGTVEAMPQILADVIARGLRPVTASMLLRP